MATELSELFSRDPLEYSTQDLDAIVAELRTKRKQFENGIPAAGSMKPKTETQKRAASLINTLGFKL